MRFMLDTDVCITLIKKRPAGLLRKLTALAPGEAGISAVTLAELRFGVAKSAEKERNATALEEFILPLETADLDKAAAAEYGRVRAALEACGKPIGPLDTLIAAHALSLGAVLVTHNTREFRRVAGLVLADWPA